MRFSEHLGAHITPEWRKQYIRYEELKNLLYEAQESAPDPEVSGEAIVERHYAKFEETFLKLCEKELTKINTFFSEKEAEAMRRFAQLSDELRQVDSQTVANSATLRRRRSSIFLLDNSEVKVAKSDRRKVSDLKLAFSEFYLSLVLLQNYQKLNFTGFRKILKKYDKMMKSVKGAEFRISKVESAPFYTSKHIDNLILETETSYINDLEEGNRQKAMNKLRVPPLGAKGTNWTTFRMGLFSGIFLVLLLLIILAGVLIPVNEDCWPAVRMYRGMFLIILHIFLLGLNTYGWRKAGVNHVLIFELDPRNNLSHEDFIEMSMFFADLWAISILAFIYLSLLPSVPSYISPLILACVMVVFLLNPTKTLNYRARFWLLRILAHILIAPFHAVGFADFWLADQLNSLTTVLLDLEFLLCFYICEVDWVQTQCYFNCNTYSYLAKALVACLPAWFRFAQCLRRYRDSRQAFPHLVNAGKYSTTFFVVLFGSLVSTTKEKYPSFYQNPLFYIWMLSLFVSSCYTLTWDLKMDWGLLEKSVENKLLRKEIVYWDKYYYFAMMEDFILRFIWTVSISLALLDVVHAELLRSILAPLEVFRRFVWNFFRLENEHLNNCGQFRAVRDISIKPDKEKEEENPKRMEDMMDDEGQVPLHKHKESRGEVRFDETQLLLRNTSSEETHCKRNSSLMRGDLSNGPQVCNSVTRIRFQIGDDEGRINEIDV
ncbi:xenotropic and polytropic retrovirus receptor 1 homolog [Acanthaster planci]|uniref:Xenotropic and polytropic retrovirus receptor 1 homolog n=1 Tax=Acanthaster planci TaxID=133434 RepID=A0A8B7ZS48_ACAPL|nr:xenotropic and polytropic retrovirus receptor 1 homolog [Acanthaster planci]